MICVTNLFNVIWEDTVKEKSHPIKTVVLPLLVAVLIALLVYAVISDDIDLSALKYAH